MKDSYHSKHSAVLSAAVAATVSCAWGATGGAAFGQAIQGPSSSQTPYVVPVQPGVQTVSILTVGDSVNTKDAPASQAGQPYRMVGIPDGLGVLDNGNGTMTVLMNHELGATSGIERAHGTAGSFVSKWTISANPANLTVSNGTDLTRVVAPVPGGAAPFGRLCSADLPAPSAFFNPGTGRGTPDRIYMNGEEVGNEGRGFGHVVTGASANTSYYLPHLGKFSWENSVASPFAQDKTVVVGTDDSTPGEVYVYVGAKNNTGATPVDRAGLTNGSLFGVQVTGLPVEGPGAGLGGPVSRPFTMGNFGDVSGQSGAQLQTASTANLTTKFNRPEDGQWDPRSPNDFYFVTTASIGQPSKLFRMRFNDIATPESGGSIEMLLDGQNPASSANGLGGRTIEMMDNMTVDSHGRVLIQEDPGGSARSAKIWLYDIATDSVALLAEHDRARFGGEVAGTIDTPQQLPVGPFNNNEEASGIIDAKDILGDGWFLMDVQAHYSIGGELVEGGQLLAMYVNPSLVPEPASLTLLAAAGGLLGLRRRSRRL